MAGSQYHCSPAAQQHVKRRVYRTREIEMKSVHKGKVRLKAIDTALVGTAKLVLGLILAHCYTCCVQQGEPLPPAMHVAHLT